MDNMLKFDLPKGQSSIIKVIGVGGGGNNAVNHMFRQGIEGVDFIQCNTDAQVLDESPVPIKVQLGNRGLGAGAKPEVGRMAAEESIEEIREILSKSTQMLFITAGMGGGTGTGAAPVIASVARELDILTVGIVTIPFTFEGMRRRRQAEQGIQEMRKYVDTLLVINNDKLRELHGDLKLEQAFAKADNVLTTAAKGIAELITVRGYINVDFEDVKTVMKDSGRAIMGSGLAEGPNRAIEAAEQALSSPLLNDNDIHGARNILLYMAAGEEDLTMDEITEITDYITEHAGIDADMIWGKGTDPTLGKNVAITIIATGFETLEAVEANRPSKNVTPLIIEKPVERPQPATQPIRHDINQDITEITLISPKQPASTEPAMATNEPENPFKPLVDPNLNNLTEPIVFTRSSENQVASQPSPSAQTSTLNQEPQAYAAPQPSFQTSTQQPRTQPAPQTQPTPSYTERSQPLQNTFQSANLREDPRSSISELPPTAVANNGQYELIPAEQALRREQSIKRLRAISQGNKTPENVNQYEAEPAYLRRGTQLNDAPPASESVVPKMALDKDNELKQNTFIHKIVD